jgi:hypothetical protein
MTDNNENAQTNAQPTLKSWLRDGATLLGLEADKQQTVQDTIKRHGGKVMEGAARDLETIEGGIRAMESSMVKGLDKLRSKIGKP